MRGTSVTTICVLFWMSALTEHLSVIGEVRCHQSYKYIDNSVTFFNIYVGGCGCFSQCDLFYIIFSIINLLVDVLKYFIKHF